VTQHTSDAILTRMMALHPKIIDLTLDRVWALLDALGNPQNDLPPVIHIAGTNGKGSTQAMIRAGLEAEGKTVHAYTSPHLARFHERIRLAGDLISEPYLTQMLDECYAANDGQPITYFEITTVAAILAFARTKADILKRGIPAIVTRQSQDAAEVIEARIEKLGCPALIQGQHWDAFEERGRLIYQDERGLLDLPPPALMGAHQFQNAGTAITALRHLGFGETAAEAASKNVTWPARMQKLTSGPLLDLAPNAEFWLDGGHNAACADTLAESLQRLPNRATHLICGLMNTKDVAGYMAPIAPHAASLHAVSIPGEVNTLPAQDTAKAASAAGIKATTAENVQQAVANIIAQDPNARILICGSLYLAGDILKSHG